MHGPLWLPHTLSRPRNRRGSCRNPRTGLRRRLPRSPRPEVARATGRASRSWRGAGASSGTPRASSRTIRGPRAARPHARSMHGKRSSGSAVRCGPATSEAPLPPSPPSPPSPRPPRRTRRRGRGLQPMRPRRRRLREVLQRPHDLVQQLLSRAPASPEAGADGAIHAGLGVWQELPLDDRETAVKAWRQLLQLDPQKLQELSLVVVETDLRGNSRIQDAKHRPRQR
mmetsp:Transcript_53637/g.173208  ORF Transcript_53637/g.173208 Transcript_53637/m.173208 type:complete len:227 (-) Transcript_53637:251-931(-)